MRELIIALMLPVAVGAAAPVRIEHRSLGATVILEVDQTKVHIEGLMRYLVVHPVAYDNNYYLGPELRLCVEGDPQYKPCGTRDLHAGNFFANAETNLRLSRASLAYLESLGEYPELRPLVNYFQNSLRFSIWQHERLLAYYRTWDVGELARDFGSLPILTEVQDILAKLTRATDNDSRWHISYYEWQKTVNELYRSQEGAVPSEVWNSFVRANHIKETIVYEEIDD